MFSQEFPCGSQQSDFSVEAVTVTEVTVFRIPFTFFRL